MDIPADVLGLLWPGWRADLLCDQLARLGLVADYWLDPPGPRVRLHDVMRSYLYGRRAPAEHPAAHARLVDAARPLCPGTGDDGDGTAWWALPAENDYLWRHLPYHLAGADRAGELTGLVGDLRWVEAKTARFGSTVPAEADLALAGTPSAAALARALSQASHLLTGLDEVPGALGATPASRLDGIPDLEQAVTAYRTRLPRPRLDPRWPLPDQPQPRGDELAETVDGRRPAGSTSRGTPSPSCARYPGTGGATRSRTLRPNCRLHGTSWFAHTNTPPRMRPAAIVQQRGRPRFPGVPPYEVAQEVHDDQAVPARAGRRRR